MSRLSSDIINRRIFKVEITDKQISEEKIDSLQKRIATAMNITLDEANYFFEIHPIEKNMYDEKDDSIDIIYKDGTIKNIAEASDMLNISLLSKKIRKNYLCYLRLLNE